MIITYQINPHSIRFYADNGKSTMFWLNSFECLQSLVINSINISELLGCTFKEAMIAAQIAFDELVEAGGKDFTHAAAAPASSTS